MKKQNPLWLKSTMIQPQNLTADINQAWAARRTSSQDNSMLFVLAISFRRSFHQGEKLVQRTESLDSWSVFAKPGKLSPALLCNFMMLSDLKLHTSLAQKPNVDARFSTYPITHYNIIWGIWSGTRAHTMQLHSELFHTFLSLWIIVNTFKYLPLSVTSNTKTRFLHPFLFPPWQQRNQFNHPVTTTCTLSSSLFSQDLSPQPKFHAPIWIITLELCYITHISWCLSVCFDIF